MQPITLPTFKQMVRGALISVLIILYATASIRTTSHRANARLIDYYSTATSGNNTFTSYTTWNPSDKSASITLSNGNLTAADTTADKGVRSISGKSSGKWYVEMTQESASTTNALVGIAKSTAALDFPGADANGWGYYSNNGNKFNSGSGSAYGASYTTSDIVMIAYDADNGKLYFGKNGTWQASGDPAAGTNAAYTGLSGTMYLMWGTSTASVTQQTMNFGASAFAYTPPTGFSGWSA